MEVKKLHRIGEIVYAMSGVGAMLEPMIAWHQAGAVPSDVPTCSHDEVKDSWLIVFKEGRCFCYRPSIPFPEECYAPDAWGSGCEYAIGAMVGGAAKGVNIRAEDAVRVAMICDPHTGGGVMTENLL
jgi:hypothetical protein